jgi:hypothetical protein
MIKLKDNIYKITTITNINETSIWHDMQVVSFCIV